MADTTEYGKLMDRKIDYEKGTRIAKVSKDACGTR